MVSNENDFRAILSKQTDRYYTVVAEEYFEGIIKAELEAMGKCIHCGGDAYDEPHYDCEAEFAMIRKKEDQADMEEALNQEPQYDD